MLSKWAGRRRLALAHLPATVRVAQQGVERLDLGNQLDVIAKLGDTFIAANAILISSLSTRNRAGAEVGWSHRRVYGLHRESRKRAPEGR